MNGWPELADGLIADCLQFFGETISYQPASGSAVSMSGIFESATTVIETVGEVAVETKKPTLKVRLSDFRNAGMDDPKRGDVVTARGQAYKVVEFQDDGHAEGTLILMRTA